MLSRTESASPTNHKKYSLPLLSADSAICASGRQTSKAQKRLARTARIQKN